MFGYDPTVFEYMFARRRAHGQKKGKVHFVDGTPGQLDVPVAYHVATVGFPRQPHGMTGPSRGRFTLPTEAREAVGTPKVLSQGVEWQPLHTATPGASLTGAGREAAVDLHKPDFRPNGRVVQRRTVVGSCHEFIIQFQQEKERV